MGSSLLKIVVIIASLIANQEPPTSLKYRQLGHLFPMNHVNREDLREGFKHFPTWFCLISKMAMKESWYFIQQGVKQVWEAKNWAHITD